uniref:Uncharacterized protein n=1 Tax=Glossina brevipalpis TaxID=37001 RepID=A0A1A9WJ08_9MUSC
MNVNVNASHTGFQILKIIVMNYLLHVRNRFINISYKCWLNASKTLTLTLTSITLAITNTMKKKGINVSRFPVKYGYNYSYLLIFKLAPVLMLIQLMMGSPVNWSAGQMDRCTEI